MSWEISGTTEFEEWFAALDMREAVAIADRVDLLERYGPGLGEPTVKRIKSSRHHNMKELRCGTKGAIRVLFAFDPARQAILLVGGEKAGRWSEWYEVNVPKADSLYDRYLAEMHGKHGM